LPVMLEFYHRQHFLESVVTKLHCITPCSYLLSDLISHLRRHLDFLSSFSSFWTCFDLSDLQVTNLGFCSNGGCCGLRVTRVNVMLACYPGSALVGSQLEVYGYFVGPFECCLLFCSITYGSYYSLTRSDRRHQNSDS